MILKTPVLLRQSLRSAQRNQKTWSASLIEVSGVGSAEQDCYFERVKRPFSRATRERPLDRSEFITQARDRPPMTMRDFPKERPNRQPQVGIIDQVVFGASPVSPRSQSQPFSLFRVQNPQPLLDRHTLDLRRWARELFRGGNALQVLPQIGG